MCSKDFKKCNKCKQLLPISAFQSYKDCIKCHKKDYYQRNKKKILEKRKKRREEISLKKKQSGEYRWRNSFRDEEEKFKLFLEQNNIEIDLNG